MRSLGFLICAILAHFPAPLVAASDELAIDVGVAQDAFEKGAFEEAESILELLLAAYPDDPDLLRRLAAVSAALGKLDDAQLAIDRAIELSPTAADIQIARANILLWRKKFSAAEGQASELASDRPNYPGLAEFRNSLLRARKARRLRVRSFGMGASLLDAEFDSGSSQKWNSQSVLAAIGWADSSVASFEIEREERLDVDERISVRVDVPINTYRAFFITSLTPNPDFRETWSVGAGVELNLSRSDILKLDARFAEYENDDVVTFNAGLQHQFSPNFAVTARSIHLLGGGESYRLGGALRFDHISVSSPDLFIILATYPDIEADGVRQLRSVAGGAKFDLAERLLLRVAASYDSRERSYERTAYTVSLQWNFRDVP